MKTFLISATVAVALAGMAAQAQASDALANAVQASVELRDGSTLHIFKDGKMAKEDAFGRAVYLRRQRSRPPGAPAEGRAYGVS
jgi:hypothetical protein